MSQPTTLPRAPSWLRVGISGRFCDRPTRSRLSVVLLCSKANAELVPKFHVALCASHAALQTVTSQFRLNATLPTLITKFQSTTAEIPHNFFPVKKQEVLLSFHCNFSTWYDKQKENFSYVPVIKSVK
jgi:hypothetical protein